MIDLNSVISKVSPGAEEENNLLKIAEKVVSSVRTELTERKLVAEPVLVGSVSKRTYLDPDIDVFIAFDKKYDRNKMVSESLDIGHRVLPDALERYAEHPYVSGHIDGVKIDIVPCYRIDPGEKIVSSVDRSPLHTRYVLDKITEEQRGEVRLLKAFMKTSGIYGSEVSTRGFSGYVCELLILENGTFLETLKTFSLSRGKYIIPEKSVKSDRFPEPVIIVDPVDADRNAGAAVSEENYARMRILSREFLLNPSEVYFTRSRQRMPIKMDRGTEMRIFRITAPDVTMDTLFPQVERFRKILFDILEEGGFYPVGSELAADDHVDVLIECRFALAPKFFIHPGPPADSERTHDFIEKWRTRNDVIGPYVNGSRLFADVPSEQLKIEDYVRAKIKDFNIGAHLNELKGKMEIIDPSVEKEKFTVLDNYFSRSVF